MSVDVGVSVGVLVGVKVSVGEAVLVGVLVCVGVFVTVGVLVCVGDKPALTISWGGFALSRLAKLTAVLLVELRAKLTKPFEVTSDETSIETHVPVAIAPAEPPMVPGRGALLYVMVISPQILSPTPRTLKPLLKLLLAKTRRVALAMLPIPWTLKRR